MPFTKEFKSLMKNLEEDKLGKPVPKEFQKKFGKTFDKKEIKSFSFAIAKSKGVRIEK